MRDDKFDKQFRFFRFIVGGGSILVVVLILINIVCVMMNGSNENICKTPFGAQDIRCIGYYNRAAPVQSVQTAD